MSQDDQQTGLAQELTRLVTDLAAGRFDGRLSLAEDRAPLASAFRELSQAFEQERQLRRQAEIQLHDVLEAYENAPGMFCSVDAQTGLIARCNSTMALRLGRHPGALLELPLEEIYVSEGRALADRWVEALLDGAPRPPGDHLLAAADGTPIVADLTGSLVKDARGHPARLRLIYRDVTDERRLTEQLAQAQKMETVGRLAGGVAHDFNNILTAVFGFIATLRAEVSSSEGLEDLDELMAAGQRAADLTRQLLAFSRRTVVSAVPLDLNARLQATARMLQRAVGETVALHFELEEDLWPSVVDPTLFDQLIMNLGVNAKDAMPLGGSLQVKTRNVVVAGDDDLAPPSLQPGAYARLSVSDNGDGIASDVLPKIFEPFFTTKPVGKGTGLGLSMAYGTAQQAGGGISVSSKLGVGTTFHLYLPRSDQVPRTVGQAAPPKPAKGGHESILLVEDEAQLRKLLTRTLERAGYQVFTAPDGHSGLEFMRIRGLPTDLLITDAVMPRLSGPALVNRLTDENLCHRALLISGYTDQPVVSGPHWETLPKPFNSETLLHRVRALLDGPARLSR